MKHQTLRFCMITTFYPPYNFGGDGIFVYRLSNELAGLGHKVDVIHCVDAYRVLTDKAPEFSFENHPNVKVHRLKSRFGFLSPLATQQTGLPFFKTEQLRKIFETRFDVIHYHNVSLVGGPQILKYGHGIKLYTMHEYWLVCPTHLLFKYNEGVCTKKSCIACGLVYKRPPQWWRYFGLLKNAVQHVDAFLSPSLFIKEIHHKMGFDAPITHLPYFIPPEKSPSNTARINEQQSEQPYFLFVGRLEKNKGLQTLIPIFQHYHKAPLLICGTGVYEEKLRKSAQGCPNIKFLGYQSQSQLQHLYRKAVALIVPSIWYDVHPIVMSEALRQKTPIIVRNLGGMPEGVTESGGGLIYDTDDDLLAAMDRLLSDPSYRNRLGLSGFKTCQEKWSIKVHMKQYFSLIQKIADTKGINLAQMKSNESSE